MSTEIINKSMDREDLMTTEGRAFVAAMDELRAELEARHLPVTSWYGNLPPEPAGFSVKGLKAAAKKALGREGVRGVIGDQNRGGADYEAHPDIENDDWHPWFLFWEAYWVIRNGADLGPGVRTLDAGGTASLFSCYLASTGAEVHSIDLNPVLVEAGRRIAKGMGWDLHSYAMNMEKLDFEDGSFDHAFSICVFEHLHFDLRRRALAEIARVLKPGGILHLTFDYRGPGVALAGQHYDRTPANLLNDVEAVHRSFDGIEGFEVMGNSPFVDNAKSYLRAPEPGREPYTFGAFFLRRV